MGEQIHPSGKPTGYRYGNQNRVEKNNVNMNHVYKPSNKSDDDLVIEENTIYEIDRECYERLKRQRRK